MHQVDSQTDMCVYDVCVHMYACTCVPTNEGSTKIGISAVNFTGSEKEVGVGSDILHHPNTCRC